MNLRFHLGLRLPGAAAGRECAAAAAVIRQLEEAERRAERDFLKVGERLAGVAQAVRKIAQESGAIAGIVSDDQMAGASQILTDLLNTTGVARSSALSAGLQRVLAATDSVQGSLRQIRTMARSFGVLGILTQIESARLAQAGEGFAGLAAEVGKLGHGIGRQTEEILSVADETRDRVRLILDQVCEADKRAGTRLEAVASVVTAGIGKLRDERDRANGASRLLAREYEETSRRVGDLVASLQCQDSTRQKTEHVRQVLAQALERCREEKALNGLGAVAGISRAQLESAAAFYGAAAARIRESLTAIAGQASAMAGQVRSLLGLEEEREESFFTAMEAHLSEILDIFEECSAAEHERGARLASLPRVIGRMSGLTEAIQAITIQMQRIALNAAIRAIHTGEPGAPLAAVAGAVQRLAADSAAIASEVGQTLDGVPETVEKLAACGSSGENSREAAQIREVIGTLHSLHEMMFARVELIGVLAGQVSADMKEACLEFGDQRETTATLGTCARQLGGIAEQCSARGHTAGGDEVLESLRSRYTMDSERRVHDGLPGLEDAPAVATGATGTGFGDNVELF